MHYGEVFINLSRRKGYSLLSTPIKMSSTCSSTADSANIVFTLTQFDSFVLRDRSIYGKKTTLICTLNLTTILIITLFYSIQLVHVALIYIWNSGAGVEVHTLLQKNS